MTLKTQKKALRWRAFDDKRNWLQLRFGKIWLLRSGKNDPKLYLIPKKHYRRFKRKLRASKRDSNPDFNVIFLALLVATVLAIIGIKVNAVDETRSLLFHLTGTGLITLAALFMQFRDYWDRNPKSSFYHLVDSTCRKVNVDAGIIDLAQHTAILDPLTRVNIEVGLADYITTGSESAKQFIQKKHAEAAKDAGEVKRAQRSFIDERWA